MRRRLAILVVAVAIPLGIGTWVRARLPPHLSAATDFGVVPFVGHTLDDEAPGSERGGAVLLHLLAIREGTRSSRYAHATDVRPSEGRYHWDCSGMVGWLLRRHAPAAFAALGRGRPVAADFARTIAREGRGWERIRRIEELRAGDVFAWRSPPELRTSGATGHVGIVLAAPRRATALGEVWEVRIADSTTLPHDRDSRAASGDVDGGLGTGVMTFVASDGGASHYGWHGPLSPIYVRTDVVFGRLR